MGVNIFSEFVMSKVDDVVLLVKSKGRSQMMRHLSTMNENQKERIYFCGKNAFSFCIDESVDMNNVFTVSEIIEGINKYDLEVGCKDGKYDSLIALFQPIILTTQWFQEYQNSKYFEHSLFDFSEGRFTDPNMQGMFEIFCYQQDIIETYKASQLTARLTNHQIKL